MRYCGAVWDNPGMGTAISHIYRVRALEATAETHTDAGEFDAALGKARSGSSRPCAAARFETASW